MLPPHDSNSRAQNRLSKGVLCIRIVCTCGFPFPSSWSMKRPKNKTFFWLQKNEPLTKNNLLVILLNCFITTHHYVFSSNTTLHINHPSPNPTGNLRSTQKSYSLVWASYLFWIVHISSNIVASTTFFLHEYWKRRLAKRFMAFLLSEYCLCVNGPSKSLPRAKIRRKDWHVKHCVWRGLKRKKRPGLLQFLNSGKGRPPWST